MRMRIRAAAVAAVLVAGLNLTSPSPVDAQDNRLRVSIGAATTTGTPDSELALTGSVGYRFAERLSFDIEATAFEGGDEAGLPFAIAGGGTVIQGNQVRFSSGIGQGPLGALGGFGALQDVGIALYPPVLRTVDSKTIIATLGFRYEFPVQAGRLLPYVTAGLGASRTERTLEYGLVPLAVSGPRPGAQAQAPFFQLPSEKVEHTGLAGSLGVGASLRLFAQLYVDADARYFRLDNDRSMGRLGGGLSYRF